MAIKTTFHILGSKWQYTDGKNKGKSYTGKALDQKVLANCASVEEAEFFHSLAQLTSVEEIFGFFKNSDYAASLGSSAIKSLYAKACNNKVISSSPEMDESFEEQVVKPVAQKELDKANAEKKNQFADKAKETAMGSNYELNLAEMVAVDLHEDPAERTPAENKIFEISETMNPEEFANYCQGIIRSIENRYVYLIDKAWKQGDQIKAKTIASEAKARKEYYTEMFELLAEQLYAAKLITKANATAELDAETKDIETLNAKKNSMYKAMRSENAETFAKIRRLKQSLKDRRAVENERLAAISERGAANISEAEEVYAAADAKNVAAKEENATLDKKLGAQAKIGSDAGRSLAEHEAKVGRGSDSVILSRKEKTKAMSDVLKTEKKLMKESEEPTGPVAE